MTRKVDRKLLEELEPLSALDERYLQEIVLMCNVEPLKADAVLFRAGDCDGNAIYLLSGTVRLSNPQSSDTGDYRISGSTAEARYPIADVQPREVTAIADTDVEILRLPADELDSMINRDQLHKAKEAAGAAEVGKSRKGSGWMGGLFKRKRSDKKDEADADSVARDRWQDIIMKSEILKVVPLKNVPKLLTRVRPTPVKAGEVVIKQGQEGDAYYLIVEGAAVVSRLMQGYKRPIPVAELSAGAGFGEEALISNAKRNATVTMKSDGTLARLSKADFEDLLKEPLLMWLSQNGAQRKIADGAKWLDVRSSGEHERARLANAVSIPLHELRRRVDELDRDTLYICYCENGRLSSTAAFLLKQLGYRAGVLRGGVRQLSGLKGS